MKSEADRQGINVNYSGMSFKAATFSDAVKAMSLLFFLTENVDEEFDIDINVDASRGGPSGSAWAICGGSRAICSR
jgi:ribosomal protein S9